VTSCSQRADHAGEGPVGQVAQDREPAARVQPDQELGAGPGDLREEVPEVEAADHQHQHGLARQVQQLAGPVQLAGGGGAERGPGQGAGPGLDQGHELDDRVAGHSERGAHLAQRAPVRGCTGHLD
jgi:hypothetical protein